MPDSAARHEKNEDPYACTAVVISLWNPCNCQQVKTAYNDFNGMPASST
jgi:hypothetical protein